MHRFPLQTAYAAAVSIERRITCRTWALDRNRSWLMMPQPLRSVDDAHAEPFEAAFSAAPTRVIPPAIRPDSASARSFVAETTVILRASGPMRIDRRREYVHVDIRRGEHHGTDLVRNGIAVSRIELAQALDRQHGAHAVGNDVNAAGGRSRQTD